MLHFEEIMMIMRA